MFSAASGISFDPVNREWARAVIRLWKKAKLEVMSNKSGDRERIVEVRIWQTRGRERWAS